MKFWEVLQSLIESKEPVQFARNAWNGNLTLYIQKPGGNDLNSVPYLYTINSDGDRAPYTVSPESMFAEDWSQI